MIINSFYFIEIIHKSDSKRIINDVMYYVHLKYAFIILHRLKTTTKENDTIKI